MRLPGEPPFVASDRARALHERLWVADLHADSLLWGRDLLRRADRGHVDVPRLIEGNVALQVFAASTKSPRHLKLERNDDRSDDVILLALALGWPSATCRRLLPRALHMAARADAMAARSEGRLTIIRSRADLAAYEAARAARPAITAGLLSIEGAHALDGDPANVEVVADAGFRMMSPSHFFDNAFGGSAHGIEKGGLTDAGREMVRRMEARRMLVDVAHASAATIDDVLAMATRPVVASHTGVRGVADNARNLTRRPPARHRGDGRPHRDRVLADRLRRRGRRLDRSLDPLRGRRRRRRARRARLRLRWRGPDALRRDRARPADGRAPGRPVSTTTPSPRSWAATPGASSRRHCPRPDRPSAASQRRVRGGSSKRGVPRSVVRAGLILPSIAP